MIPLTHTYVAERRKELGFQLQVEAAYAVLERARKTRGCRMLVFGCGKDSIFWKEENQQWGGRTLFLEDQPEWAQLARDQGCEVLDVSYASRRREWREDLEWLVERPYDAHAHISPITVFPRLQDGRPWDVILIDAPAGHGDKTPGRIISIGVSFLLARVATRTSVFLDDCDRVLESTVAKRLWTRTEPITKRFWRLHAR